MSSLYCSKCGTQLVANASYCHVCGAVAESKETTATRTTTATTQEYSINAQNVVKRVEELIREGNVSRIIVKDERGRQLLEIPVTIGVVGVVLAPWLAALGVIAALATRCTLVVERRTAATNKTSP